MKKKYLFITMVYAIFVLWLSIQPITQETPEWFPYQDKVIHTILYAILSSLLALGMKRSEKQYLIRTIFFLSVIISFIYGFLIEICQIFIPTRSFEMFDLLANLTGALAGVILVIGFSFIISKLPIKERVSP